MPTLPIFRSCLSMSVRWRTCPFLSIFSWCLSVFHLFCLMSVNVHPFGQIPSPFMSIFWFCQSMYIDWAPSDEFLCVFMGIVSCYSTNICPRFPMSLKICLMSHTFVKYLTNFHSFCILFRALSTYIVCWKLNCFLTQTLNFLSVAISLVF